MKTRSRYILVFAAIIAILYAGYRIITRSRNAASAGGIAAPAVLDSAAIINDLRYLASDTCEGRGPGSAGHEKAVERIASSMREAGLDSFGNQLVHPFTGKKINNTRSGKNIIGWIKGTVHPEKYIVISAHYDHLGIAGGKIYYGASDNASGTACLLGMAGYFKQNPQPYSLIFAAFDREETRMEGAYHFIDSLPAPLTLSAISMNLNVDMITRNDNREVFICGLYHYPSFGYVFDTLKAHTTMKLLKGHDGGDRYDDWTTQSDHFAFHIRKIPFLYIGVEDHPDYHKPTDTFDKTDCGSYIETCNMIVLLTKLLKP
ncbi:MAG TPA: M28 family peptidase [Chitinophagaceae bacterium]|nr:M28 family peptidase [Chitinophagaceae bacterium]